jgi:hypothetical protein
VPVVDFADSTPSILNGKEIMKFIMKGIDLKTFRPIKSTEEHKNDPMMQSSMTKTLAGCSGKALSYTVHMVLIKRKFVHFQS